jgi:parallel beta-helix repeat protein
MNRKAVSGIMLITLLIGVLTLAFNIQPVKSWSSTETIYIRADGSVDPETAPISTSDNITYTLTESIDSSNANYGIAIERNNTILDGAGYTLQGIGYGAGIFLSGRSNVTIKNMEIKAFDRGIILDSSSNNSIVGCNLTANNFSGIELSTSSNYNIISGNIVYLNSEDGISLIGAGNNTLSGNILYLNNEFGIILYDSKSNVLVGNNASNNGYGGIFLQSASNNNTIIDNNVSSNTVYWGIKIYDGSNNTVSGNTITKNYAGIELEEASNNVLFHNNIIDNIYQTRVVYAGYTNTWDNGYPSGGNYWSDYTGIDQYSGSYQNETGSDRIGDTNYVIDADNRDRYPLMKPWPPIEHELESSITAPATIKLGSASFLNATVNNLGINDEIDVELVLLINGTIRDSTTISPLPAENSHTLSYLWTPTVAGTYNVTSHVPPLAGELNKENNRATKFVTVYVPPPYKVGVKTGDWIKMDYTISGATSGTPLPQWLKVEFLSVEGTSATVRVTMHMSNGAEQNQTMTVDIVAGGGTFGTFSGLVIPANCTTGDSIYMAGYGNVTIAGETTRTYAGASRTVVYASFSQVGTQLTYYWDKQTGVMVEASVVSGSVTATARATETNMWQAQPSGLLGLLTDPTIQYILIIVVIAIVTSVTFFAIRRRKKPE